MSIIKVSLSKGEVGATKEAGTSDVMASNGAVTKFVKASMGDKGLLFLL